MKTKSQNKLGKTLLGAGSVSVFLALLCCGFTWIFAGLFATLGLSFLLQDSILISITILGIIIAFIGWKMLRK
ncbi:MAG: hypothetical protein M3405_08745 [Acidobacteriota bacterium]|nr:hypothetical protein [Acidobacteriota bacterium]